MNYKDTLRENELKLLMYLVLMTLIIVGIGYFISDICGFRTEGLIISVAIAVVMNFISYFFSDTIVIKSSKAIPIDEKAYADYVLLVKEMCERNNIKCPRLYMINTKALNAFATGRNKDKAIVAVTKGLLEKLSPNEIRGVVAHELSHIQHGDIFVMSAIGVMAGLIPIIASVFRYTGNINRVGKKTESGANMLIAVIIGIAAPVCAMLIKSAVSRTREYMADAEGAKICGNPNFLADALEKIKYDGNPLPSANEATAHLYIANPLNNKALQQLMSTHPDTDDRIQRLRNTNIN